MFFINPTPPPPAWPGWQQRFSVSSALQAAAGAAAVKTGSDLAGTSAEPAAPAVEQVVSHVHAVAAAEPKQKVSVEMGRERRTYGQKHRQSEIT